MAAAVAVMTMVAIAVVNFGDFRGVFTSQSAETSFELNHDSRRITRGGLSPTPLSSTRGLITPVDTL